MTTTTINARENTNIDEMLPKYMNVAKPQLIYHDHLLDEVINQKLILDGNDKLKDKIKDNLRKLKDFTPKLLT